MKKHFGSFPRLASGATIPLSKAVRAGDFVFLSGQLGLDATGKLAGGGIAEQTRQAFANIEGALAEAGAGLKDVVKVAVWITDAKDFAGFNEVYGTYFGESPPTRSTVVSSLVVPGARVEIEVTAYLVVESQ